MIVDLLFVVFAFMMVIPLVTGYFAYSYGHSFWLWFVIGCFLPVVANILLLIMIKNYEKKRKYNSFLTQYEDQQMTLLIEGEIKKSENEKINDN